MQGTHHSRSARPQRGLQVDHATFWRWVQHSGLRARRRNPRTPDQRVDETTVRVKGRWCYLYRAINATGTTIDFGQDLATASQALASVGRIPVFLSWNILLTGLIGVVVDAVTGGWYKLESKTVSLSLQSAAAALAGGRRPIPVAGTSSWKNLKEERIE